jgi:hypothetical protein
MEMFFFENFYFVLAIRELFHRVQQIHKQLIIISIAKQITNIHRQFTEETPLFSSQILTIEPLNTVKQFLYPNLKFSSSYFSLNERQSLNN